MSASVILAICVFVFSGVVHRAALSVSSSSLDTSSQSFRFRRQSQCDPDQFKCSNGQCISSYNVCDGAKDCNDGSDETASSCKSVRCLLNAFKCAYGACIDQELRCDGKADCADGSDEQSCKGSKPSNTASQCGSENVQCANGQCINQFERCDGVKHCEDGSDETRQLCKDLKCLSSSFQCSYGACVEQSVKCNGQNDCHDGSDELGCPQNVTTFTPSNNRPDTAGSCRLPEHPTHGVYTSTLCHAGDPRPACRNTPCLSAPHNWLLKYSCNANYQLTSTDSDYSICENGVWKNPLDCIKLCSPLTSLSVDVRCTFAGHEVPCERIMKPGTIATAKCKQHYREVYKPEYSSLLCQDNGEWSDRLFYCSPVQQNVGDSKDTGRCVNSGVMARPCIALLMAFNIGCFLHLPVLRSLCWH